MARKIDDVRARQGRAGRPVLGVLVISLILCALAVLGYLAWAWTSAPGVGGGDGVEQSPAVNSPANPVNPAPTAN